MNLDIKEVILPSGQVVMEATCPFDSTIKPRLPKKEVKQDEAKVDFDVSTSSDEDSDITSEG